VTPNTEATEVVADSKDAVGETAATDPTGVLIVADGKDWKNLIDQEEVKTEVIAPSDKLIDAS